MTESTLQQCVERVRRAIQDVLAHDDRKSKLIMETVYEVFYEHNLDSSQSATPSSRRSSVDPDTDFLHTIAFIQYRNAGLKYAFEPESDVDGTQMDCGEDNPATHTQPTQLCNKDEGRNKDAADFTTACRTRIHNVTGGQVQSQPEMRNQEQAGSSTPLDIMHLSESRPAKPKEIHQDTETDGQQEKEKKRRRESSWPNRPPNRNSRSLRHSATDSSNEAGHPRDPSSTSAKSKSSAPPRSLGLRRA